MPPPGSPSCCTTTTAGSSGVRGEGPDGPVERHGPVVLATSSFDWDPELVEELLGLDQDNFGSMAPDSIRGDGDHPCPRRRRGRRHDPADVRADGARVALPDGAFGNGPEYAMPHAMIVDRAGRRFCNDSYWVDLVAEGARPGRPAPAVLPRLGRAAPSQVRAGRHATRRGYPDGSRHVGAHAAGARASAGHRRRAARGHRGELQRARTHGARTREFGRGTVEFINRFSGDPDHAPSPVLGRSPRRRSTACGCVLLGTAIGSSGVRIDGDGHVLDEAGAVMPGPLRGRLVRRHDDVRQWLQQRHGAQPRLDPRLPGGRGAEPAPATVQRPDAT